MTKPSCPAHAHGVRGHWTTWASTVKRRSRLLRTRRAQEMLERGKESMQLAQQYVGIGIFGPCSRRNWRGRMRSDDG